MRASDLSTFNAFLQSKLDNFDKDTLFPLLDKNGIPFSEINDMAHLFSRSDIKEMGLTQKIKSDKYGQELEYVKHPVSISGTDKKFSDPVEPPALGQHTEEILGKYGFNLQRPWGIQKRK